MVSVSRLIDLLNKPFLLQWSNNLGLKGINLSDFYKESASKGIKNHNKIELFIKENIEFEGSDKLKKSLEGFEIIGCEIPVNNEFINGRIDLVLLKNNQIYVCDFKSSKNIYLSTKLQLSAYKYLYNANKVCYINIDTLEIIVLNIDTENYWRIIRNLYSIYITLNSLNEKL